MTMFSSITSFLPSLPIGSSKDLPRPTVNPNEPQSDDEDEGEPRIIPPQPEAGRPAKAKEREGKGPTETFVFVRPPPSKSNHPLNLQVQLVPPNSKPPTGTSDGVPLSPTSASSTVTDFNSLDGTSLRRTPSNRSQSSTSTFNNSSTTSFSSIASSTTSSGNSRRAIVPLYNLQAHNVMANVVVDAGTDAKIAKFQKRGLEMIDLAFVEPVEVWGEKEGRRKNGEIDLRARKESVRLSVDDTGVMATNLSMGSMSQSRSGSSQGASLRPRSSHSLAQSRPGSEIRGASANGSVNLSTTPSAVSLNSQPTSSSAHGQRDGSQEIQYLHPSGSRTSMHSESISPTSATSVTPTASYAPVNPTATSPTPKKNIFGKLFNKKTATLSSSTTSTPPVATPHSKQTEGLPSFSSFSILQSPKTPKASQVGKQDGDDEISTPTLSSSKKGHSRNLSLTGIASPIKSTLKNRSRFSGLMTGGTPLSNVESLSALGITEDKSRLSVDKNRGRESSPNPSLTKSTKSRLSWIGTTTTHSSDSLEANTTATHAQPFPIIIPPSQTEGTANARQQQQQQQFQLRPPVLGIQPTFVSSFIPPPPVAYLSPTSGTYPFVAVLSPKASTEKEAENLLKGQRALMYVWFVRRWLKKRSSTLLGAVNEITGGVGGFFGKKKEPSSQDTSADIAGPPPLLYGGVEVRFEWKRAKGKEARRGEGRKRGRGNRTPSGFSSIAGAGADSDGEAERMSVRSRETLEKLKKEEKRKHRMSTGSVGISISQENGTEEGQLVRSPEDDGNESDPEDSETPWVCTLKLRRNTSSSAETSSFVSPASPPPGARSHPDTVPLEPPVLRLKVGTLSPTPHHPKVVAMLKVPFPLPDVEVERMAIVKRETRTVVAQDVNSSNEDFSQESYAGLKLTAEEIKDIVCSTGLWLVVREGFGGVGKVTRKGDGWRIRG